MCSVERHVQATAVEFPCREPYHTLGNLPATAVVIAIQQRRIEYFHFQQVTVAASGGSELEQQRFAVALRLQACLMQLSCRQDAVCPGHRNREAAGYRQRPRYPLASLVLHSLCFQLLHARQSRLA